MYVAVISTLIFASPGASAFSGSRTDPVTASVRVAPGAGRASADPSADYWHALATKRLEIIGKRERRIVALLVRIHKLRAERLSGRSGERVPGHGNPVPGNSVRSIICSVFGAHCSEAISVATCESTLRVTARNGDYWGLFQFGSFARAHYGFAWDALTQSRAAYRYWRDAGWSPWQCQP